MSKYVDGFVLPVPKADGVCSTLTGDPDLGTDHTNAVSGVHAHIKEAQRILSERTPSEAGERS